MKLLISTFSFLILFSFIACESEAERTARLRIEALQREQLRFRTDSIRVADSIAHYEAQFIVGSIKPNQGMFQALRDMNISIDQSLKLINALRFEVELTNVKVDEILKAKLLHSDSSIVSELHYKPDIVTTHILTLDSTGEQYSYTIKEEPTDTRYNLITGTLKQGSTLDQSLREAGIPSNLVGVVNGVLKCKINFRMFARNGDTFQVLLREKHFNDQVIESEILYTTYSGEKTGSYEAFKFEDEDPKSTYNAHYTANGEALIHSGLRYPVKRLHITSTWGWRRHPVTGNRKMHNGVDYKGRIGDPVYSVAAGTVVTSSYDKYSGNKIGIRHSDKSISYYLHLDSRFVKTGQYVKTQQRIGTLGKTGRVTGPHLHFAFKAPNGKWINPLRKRMIATPKLQGDKYERLKGQIVEIRSILENTKDVALQKRDSLNATSL